jgi:hypothetical protein
VAKSWIVYKNEHSLGSILGEGRGVIPILIVDFPKTEKSVQSIYSSSTLIAMSIYIAIALCISLLHSGIAIAIRVKSSNLDNFEGSHLYLNSLRLWPTLYRPQRSQEDIPYHFKIGRPCPL